MRLIEEVFMCMSGGFVHPGFPPPPFPFFRKLLNNNTKDNVTRDSNDNLSSRTDYVVGTGFRRRANGLRTIKRKGRGIFTCLLINKYVHSCYIIRMSFIQLFVTLTRINKIF